MATDDTIEKPKPVRGPNGQFVSLKKPEKSATTDKPSPKIHDSSTFYDDLSFYGQAIRRHYKNSTWFYALEDLFPLVQVTDPSGFLETIQKMPFYKELYKTNIFEVDIPSQLAENPKTIMADQKAVIELVNALREEEKFFPGPFLQWIATTSALTFEEQLERSKSIESAI